MKRILVAVAASLALLLSGGLPSSAAPRAPYLYSGPVPLPTAGVLFGAFVALDAHNGLDHTTAWNNFTSLVGRPSAVERVYYNWGDAFPTADDEWSRDQGRTLFFSWSANDGITGICTPWADIAAGLHDAEIDSKAAGLAAFGAPFFFSFHHEPTNAPPHGGSCGNGADYIAATRHVIDRFHADGVTDMSYAFTSTALSFTHDRGDEFYAGDSYVDIIAADGYNWYGCPFHGGPWRSFQQILQDFYDYGVSKNKPMIVAEYGSGEDPAVPNRKAQWFSDAADTMKQWPLMVGALYYNVGNGGTCDRYVDSSAASLQSFRTLGADPYANPPLQTAPATVADFSFTPQTASIPAGTAVQWTFNGPSSHTVTDTSGLAQYDSGAKAPGSTFLHVYTASGIYQYRCTIHTQMRGTVRVPMSATPRSGIQSTTFTITWSADNAPTGFAFDVQIKRPGSTTWSDWKPTQYLASGSFVPDSGVGTYRFRSRLRNTATNKGTGYSPALQVKVTA